MSIKITYMINFFRTLRIRRDNSENGIVRMIGDILCENVNFFNFL